MANNARDIDPGRHSARTGLRIGGAILLIIGVLLIGFGAVRMFSPAWSDDSPSLPDSGNTPPRPSFDDSRGHPSQSFEQFHRDSQRTFDEAARKHRERFEDFSRRSHDSFRDKAKTSFSGFAMVAAGGLCAFVGTAMLIYGYMGRVARYTAGELAPVASDTVNYMGRNTKEGIRDISAAISSGIAEGMNNSGDSDTASEPPAPPTPPGTCPTCNATNDASARFCDQCGQPLK